MSKYIQTELVSKQETSSSTVELTSSKFQPTSAIKHILGKIIKINGREKFKVPKNANSKFEKVESDGMVWKYVISTVESFRVPVKGVIKETSRWYVTEGHYKKLDKISSNGSVKSLDESLLCGEIIHELVPCKKKGVGFTKYFTWLSPDEYIISLDKKELILE